MRLTSFRANALPTTLAAALLTLPTLAQAQDKAEAPKEGEKAASSDQKILVLPYQPVYRSVKQKKVKLATDYLVRELDKSKNVSVLRGGIAKEGAKSASFQAAQELLAAADKQEAAKNVHEAIKTRIKSIAAMEKNAAAIPEAADYIRAHHLLARAQFWAGEDKAAKATLDVAARMDPNFELAGKDFSRFYRKNFDVVAKKVVRDKAGTLLVRSALPGARIFLNGLETAVAPVTLERALPGKHLVQARVAGVPPAGQIINIKAGKNPEYTVSFGDTWGGMAVGAVADAIAENKLPKDAVAKAVQAGKDSEASYVVAGGMAEDKVAAKFNVHTFVINVATGGVMTLDTVTYDLDMLTADADVINVVRAVERSLKNFTDAGRAVASIDKKVSQRDIVNKFNAQPKFQRRGTRNKVVKKNGRRKVIRSLKSTSIQIKDEEE